MPTRPASKSVKDLILRALAKGPVSVWGLPAFVGRDRREVRRARAELEAAGLIEVTGSRAFATARLARGRPAPSAPHAPPAAALCVSSSGIVRNDVWQDFTSLGPGASIVYALVDPRDCTVFYVGRTASPRNRLKCHRKASRRGHDVSPKAARVLAILAAGEKPLMLPLEALGYCTDGAVVENAWIDRLAGNGELLNRARAT